MRLGGQKSPCLQSWNTHPTRNRHNCSVVTLEKEGEMLIPCYSIVLAPRQAEKISGRTIVSHISHIRVAIIDMKLLRGIRKHKEENFYTI